jgi:hypothetical protein
MLTYRTSKLSVNCGGGYSDVDVVTTVTEHIGKRMTVPSSGTLHRVTLVRTDVSKDLSAFIIMRRISELGTTSAISSQRRTLRSSIVFLVCLCISLQRASGASFS